MSFIDSIDLIFLIKSLNSLIICLIIDDLQSEGRCGSNEIEV